MRMPRWKTTYCPHCNSHEEHEVVKNRRGKDSGNTLGKRQQKRGLKGIGNSGKFSRPAVGQKPTSKTDLKYVCQECGKAHQREGFRAGRIELHD